VQESQWLLKLHTYALLNNSFQPTSEIRVLRTYWRQPAEHARGIGTCILRMQKAQTQMNLQLANVISDLSGVTGQTIVRAIVAGERDPRKLAHLFVSEMLISPETYRLCSVPYRDPEGLVQGWAAADAVAQFDFTCFA
jgi:transposase